MYTIDDVVQEVKTSFGTDLGKPNRYASFFRRRLALKGDYAADAAQGAAHDGYYLCLRADELLLFAMLTRQEGVYPARSGEKMILDSWEKLRLLKQAGSDGYAWNDTRLFIIYRHTSLTPKTKRGLNYSQLIDDLGKDKEVHSLWGRPVEYKKHVSFMSKAIVPAHW